MSRKIPEFVPITPLLCSREEAGIGRWRTKKTKKGLTYFVPGPVVRGKVRHATITVRKTPRYYSIGLDYDEIDCVLPEVYAFHAVLKKAADELFVVKTWADDPSHRLLWELDARLSSQANGSVGDFRWGVLRNVTEEFVEKFLILVAMVYSRANQLYAERHGSWTKEDWLHYMRHPEPALVSLN
jgi:hypothetical protein